MMEKLKVKIDPETGKIWVPLKEKWLINTPEEKVRQEYICKLCNEYGYKLEQMKQEYTVNYAKHGTGRMRADIVVWKNKQDKLDGKYPLFVVECKAGNVKLNELHGYQGQNYASFVHAKFFIITNGEDTEYYKVIEGEIPKKPEQIAGIPKASIADNVVEIEKFLVKTKPFNRKEFSDLLFKCHNIIRNNDKLDPVDAFDEISKILFIKIRFERNNKNKNQIFSHEKFKKRKAVHNESRSRSSDDYYQYLFEETKKDFKNDDLFEPNEIIKIRENSFEAIVKELEIYNLSLTQDDVKGIAFEEFLGTTFRGELGQFFTPRTIVDFMTEILDPKEGEVICDPCCGSGGFLIKAFEYVRSQIENDIALVKNELFEEYLDEEEKKDENDLKQIELELNKKFEELNKELNTKYKKSRMYELSHNCIYGTDANPRMSRTAKMNMIMHGDGHGGVHHNDGLLNVNGIFAERFDVILTNPPFGSRVEKSLIVSNADKYTDKEKIAKYRQRYGHIYDEQMRQVTDNIGKPLLDLYETGKMSSLTEVLFIERCLNLLKPGGRMGIVLPEGVLNNSNLQKVREYVESRAKILLICSIPQDVFIASGATVKPSLLFFKKFDEEEKKQYEKILKEAEESINAQYKDEQKALKQKEKELNAQKIANDLSIEEKAQKRHELKEQKKIIKEELKELEKRIQNEIKAEVKARFNYQIPIAEVEKAGISTTGSVIENELEPLAKEFEKYRENNNLWQSISKKIEYVLRFEENHDELKLAENNAASNYNNNLQQGSIYRKVLINGVIENMDLKDLELDD